MTERLRETEQSNAQTSQHAGACLSGFEGMAAAIRSGMAPSRKALRAYRESDQCPDWAPPVLPGWCTCRLAVGGDFDRFSSSFQGTDFLSFGVSADPGLEEWRREHVTGSQVWRLASSLVIEFDGLGPPPLDCLGRLRLAFPEAEFSLAYFKLFPAACYGYSLYDGRELSRTDFFTGREFSVHFRTLVHRSAWYSAKKVLSEDWALVQLGPCARFLAHDGCGAAENDDYRCSECGAEAPEATQMLMNLQRVREPREM